MSCQHVFGFTLRKSLSLEDPHALKKKLTMGGNRY